MKNLPFILMALAALALSACSPATAYSAGTSAAIWYTKPDKPGPADTEHQIVAHEDWCYETMGYPECYPRVQRVEPDRLINVEPQNRYPLTAGQYWETVYADQ
jgi:hypothetical protein